MYFVIMLSSNLMSIIFYLVLAEEQKFLNEMYRITSTSILVSRLILNLREVAARQSGGPTLSRDQITLSWARPPHYISVSDAMLGNIGNDLEYQMDAGLDELHA